MPWVPCVRWGTRSHKEKGQFWGNIAAHYEVMGHHGELCKNGSTDRHAVLDEGSGWPNEPCFVWGADPQDFRGCPDHSEALAVFAAAVAAASLPRSLQAGSFNRE